jgi:hypothetical protein
MEAMYAEYAARFGSFGALPAERFEVRIFRDRDDYIRFTQDRFPNTGGIFIPSRKLLAAFLEGQGRDGLRRTLQHEAFHQFAYSVIGPNMPVWLNEGIAQVFEEGIYTGRQFLIGQVPPRRVRQLRQDMLDKRLIEFRRLLAMSDVTWTEGLHDRAAATVQYNQSWAMAHFLLYATDDAGQPLYRARVIRMLRLMRDGMKAPDAFVEAFSDNIAGFQQRFVEYARKLDPTLHATYVENQGILADLLTALRDRGETFDSIDAFREHVAEAGYRLQYTKGNLHWSTAQDPMTYFTDPQGRLMNATQLFFYPRQRAPMPDLVCRALDHVQLRTRFHEIKGKLEYEVLVEPR